MLRYVLDKRENPINLEGTEFHTFHGIRDSLSVFPSRIKETQVPTNSSKRHSIMLFIFQWLPDFAAPRLLLVEMLNRLMAIQIVTVIESRDLRHFYFLKSSVNLTLVQDALSLHSPVVLQENHCRIT